MSKPSVLLLGGCGYVGAALQQHLTNIGHVVGVVDLLKRGCAGQTDINNCDYRVFHEESLNRYDVVIHLAGASSFAQAEADPYSAFKSNLTGLVDLTRRLSKNQRLFYASSASVTSTGTQSNMYDVTKRTAEKVLPLVYPNSLALRFGTVCGASPNTRTDLIINRMVMDALIRGKISMSNPQTRRAILGIGDLCAAVERLLQATTSIGVARLASFEHSVAMIAQHVQAALRDHDVVVSVAETDPTPSYDVIMPASPIDGWRPKDSVASLVASLVEQHRATPGGLGSFT